MAEKPTAAFVLSLIGGIFILLGAIVVMAIMSAIGSFMGIGGSADLLCIYGAVGLIFAVIVLVGAVMLWVKPHRNGGWGVNFLLFLVFSILCLVWFFIWLVLG